jgi:hypothetical protein
VWRRWAVSLGLLAGLLAGCHDAGNRGGAPSTSRPGDGSSTTASTAPPSGPGVLAAWFADERTGWVIGEEPCPRPGFNLATCAVVSKTTDGGGAWTRLPRLDVPGPGGAGGPDYVSEVRFADPQHGWVFHRSLRATFNGGKRWQPVDLGNPVVALEPSGSRVYALVAGCGNTAGDCPSPQALYEGTVATGRWRFVPTGVELPKSDVGAVLVNRTATYAFAGTSDSDQSHQVFLARGTDGRWVRRTLPCLVEQVATMRDKNVLLAACRPAGPGGGVEVYTSSDGGGSWALVWKQPLPAQLADMAVNDEAVFVAVDNGDVLVTRDNGHTFSTAVHAGERPTVSFTSNKHGIVVGGPEPNRHVLVTRDGGVTWQQMSLPAA